MKAVTILVAILFSASAAASQPPSPSSSEARGHNSSNSHKPQSASAPDANGTPSEPNVGLAQNASGAAGKNEKEHKSPSEWWLVGLTAILAFVTGWLVLETRRLGEETKRAAEKALTHAKESSNRQFNETAAALRLATETAERQARETEASLGIAKQAAVASEEAAKAAHEQARLIFEETKLSHRPWIGFSERKSKITIHFDKRPIMASGYIRVTNVSASLAKSVMFSSKLGIVKLHESDPRKQIPIPLPDHTRPKELGGIILPGQTIEIDISAAQTIVESEPSQDVVVYLHVWVYYRDDFGAPHKTGQLMQARNGDGERGHIMKFPDSPLEVEFVAVAIGAVAD